MLFNSLSFLGFFAVLAVVYYAAPHRARWPMLLAASLFFYAAFDPTYVALLAAVTGVTYGGARVMEGATGGRRRTALGASVALVLTALLAFKYYAFLRNSLEGLLTALGVAASPLFPRLDLVLAVGLSFYTFSCVSYLADVHAGRLRAERHFGHFALYVSFFPKLLAGPIERAAPFLAQVKAPVSFDAAGVTVGLQMMLWGLFKKVVIADHLAVFVDDTYALAAFASPADLLIATYFFAFQLYCDFSGYSDMAIGASKVLGIDLMENFRRPYLARSTREFWSKRWHVSLASWFRDYMYFPLGGSRVGTARHYLNVLAVFMVSGLWHGANWTFVVWGGLNGLYHVVGEATDGLRTRVRHAIRFPRGLAGPLGVVTTFHLILVTWVFFRAPSIADAWQVLSRVAAAAATLPSQLGVRLQDGGVLYSIGLIALLVGVEVLDERRPVWERLAPRPVYVRWAVYYAVLAALLLLGSWQLRTFVYMEF